VRSITSSLSLSSLRIDGDTRERDGVLWADRSDVLDNLPLIGDDVEEG
jgi:hypothetical protein